MDKNGGAQVAFCFSGPWDEEKVLSGDPLEITTAIPARAEIGQHQSLALELSTSLVSVPFGNPASVDWRGDQSLAPWLCVAGLSTGLPFSMGGYKVSTSSFEPDSLGPKLSKTP